MRDLIKLSAGDSVRVEGYDGVAWRVIGDEMKDGEDTDWSGVQYPTGNVEVRMVGDDRTFVFEPGELTLIDEDEFCHGCGQIGCGH